MITTKVSAIDHLQILDKLHKNSHEAYFVGGCVRDTLLGYTPNDFDIVTSASPTTIALLFKDENLNMVGKSFLVSIINGIEVSTFRSEVYEGYLGKPEVSEAISIEDDLSRRDFTINAMAALPHNKSKGTFTLIDPFDGEKDLSDKTIRFVGSPKDRIKDDPCRILRAFRFCSLFGDEYIIEKNTKEALKEYVHLIKEFVPPERVRLEIMKVLTYEKPSIFFRLLKEYELLEFILPSLNKCFGVDGGNYHGETIFDHNLMSGDFLPKTKPLLRLAGYLHDVGKPDAFNGTNFKDHAIVGEILVKSDLERLKFSTNEINYVVSLVASHMNFITGMKRSSLRKFLSNLKSNNISWKDILLLKISDRNANTTKTKFTKQGIKELVFMFYNALKVEKVFGINDLKIDGSDLIVYLNMKEGPEIGGVLKNLFDMVMEMPSINSKFVLLDIANMIVKGV